MYSEALKLNEALGSESEFSVSDDNEPSPYHSLHSAIVNVNLEEVKKILAEEGQKEYNCINCNVDPEGTFLMMACSNFDGTAKMINKHHIVSSLLRARADPFGIDQRGNTALHVAAREAAIEKDFPVMAPVRMCPVRMGTVRMGPVRMGR